MNFEAGKYYKTRGGKKVFVAAVAAPFGEFTWPICGYIEGSESPTSWRKNGHIYGADDNPNDLIAEWKEPVTVMVTGWLCLYADGVFFHTVKPVNNRLIAMREIQVNLVEGEGLQ